MRKLTSEVKNFLSPSVRRSFSETGFRAQSCLCEGSVRVSRLTVRGKLTGAPLLKEEITVELKYHIFPYVSKGNILREKKENLGAEWVMLFECAPVETS